MNRYLCGVPKDKCVGTSTSTCKGLGIAHKMHASPEQAFTCMERYLLSGGYKKVGSREYQKEGEAILVLNKKSRFGSVMRSGKSGEKGTARGSRFMPKRRHGGAVI